MSDLEIPISLAVPILIVAATTGIAIMTSWNSAQPVGSGILIDHRRRLLQVARLLRRYPHPAPEPHRMTDALRDYLAAPRRLGDALSPICQLETVSAAIHR